MSDTIGQTPDVSAEMVAAGAKAIAGLIFTRAYQNSSNKHVDLAHAAITGALAGRTVVELPEPDGRTWTGWSMWDAEARHVEARVDPQGRPFVRCEDRMWLVSEAEAVGLALVAAAREALRLASESSEDGGRDG